MDDLQKDAVQDDFDEIEAVVLFHRYLEGFLDAKDIERLNIFLSTSERAKRLFVRYLTQEAFLSEVLLQDEERESPQAERTELGSGYLPGSRNSAPASGLASDASFDSSAHNARGQLPASFSPTNAVGVLFQRTTFKIVGTCTVFLATLLVVFLVGPRHASQSDLKSEERVAVTSESLTVESPREKGVVERAVQLSHPGVNTVKLDSGTATLSVAKMGEILVEGPAHLELIGPLRARMSHGRIKVRVTEESGHGFTVETPYGDVTDLGTEFGLDLTKRDEAGLVVFDGAVDLRVAELEALSAVPRVQRLCGGEAVTFKKGGEVQRMMAVMTDGISTFSQAMERSTLESEPIITNVSDNCSTEETKKFYEIIPNGLREDALAYVDRLHEWNGFTKRGMPKYLVGADYVKPFNEDKLQQNIQIDVTLARPAKLYVFFDARLQVPSWLKKGFRKTGNTIGVDAYRPGSLKLGERGDGPGVSMNHRHQVWVRVVKKPGKVTLGSPNAGNATHEQAAMYGIAAVALSERELMKYKAVASVQEAKE